MNHITQITQFIIDAVIYAAPYFALSIFLSVLVRTLKLEGTIKRVFEKNVLVAILLATAVGAFSPFCSCTVIPIIAGLIASGVPLAPIMSFWIASPTMDPEIFALTVGILGWPIAIARLVATLALSLGAGYLTLLVTRTHWFKEIPLLIKEKVNVATPASVDCCESTPTAVATPIMMPEVSTASMPMQLAGGLQPIALDIPIVEGATCNSSDCSMPVADNTIPFTTQIRNNIQAIKPAEFGREMAKDSWMIGKWLLIAFLMEALITLYVPQTAVASLLGSENSFAVPIAALIGIPLYLTNITALPIISGLLAQGMQAGAAISFLIAGPVTTMPAMTAVFGVVHKRIFILYLSLGLGGAIILGFVTNLFF